MKTNNLFLLSILAIAFGACQKEDNSIKPSVYPESNMAMRTSAPAVNVNTGIGNVPASFTQKVLIENVTGAPYNRSPLNDWMIAQQQRIRPNQIIAASFHKDDAMMTNATADLVSFIGGSPIVQYPAVMINRAVTNNKIFNTQQTWQSTVASELSYTAQCGLAIQSTLQNNQLRMDIHAGFINNFSGNYKMCVYLIENKISRAGNGYDQANGYNFTVGNPFYNMGNPIVNYVHNNVMRREVTTLSGITIPSIYLVPGGHMIQSLAFDWPPALDVNNTYLVAFIYDAATLHVVNSQVAKINTTKNWD
jgi:hypothetical protein